VEVLTDEDKVYEEKEADNAQRNILGFLNVRRAVCDCASKHDDIGVEEDKVADPSVNLADSIGSLRGRPILVSIVETHVSSCKSASQSGKNRCNDADGSQN